MLGVKGYRTKQDLKLAVGESLRYVETSIFCNEYTPNGEFPVVGPTPYSRKWFANVTMRQGVIYRVK